MLIGIDFDNTIVCYDHVFHEIALQRQLIAPTFPTSKGAIRDHLRSAGLQNAWTEMQGYVYGRCMAQAIPFGGVVDFFTLCQEQGINVAIISHKTEHPCMGPRWPLHPPAKEWLQQHGIKVPTFFEPTKQAKLQRIATLGCSHMIDDLPEIFSDPTFPCDVERLLFSPTPPAQHVSNVAVFPSWKKITETLVPCVQQH